jgi:hypothetical protein
LPGFLAKRAEIKKNMSLEDDLKARTLALISQQMANWVVEIQRTIASHQENLVRSLDEIQERVARYDEKINEGDIEMAIGEVVAAAGPIGSAAPSGPSQEQLKDSLTAIEKGTNLSEVLTYLVNEVSQHVMRCAMFIIKGQNAIGWYARGVDSPDSVKQITISLNADTVFRIIHNSRHALRGHSSHSPGTVQALARLGGDPQGILGVPLVLRDKLAAILYCDSDNEEIPPATADMIEIMVLFAGKIIDILAMAPKSAAPPAAAKASGGSTPERVAALKADNDDVRQRVGLPPSRPAPAPAPSSDEGSSTVMFNANSFAQLRQQSGGGNAKAAVAAPAGPPLSPEEQKSHDDAKRFARLVVSEIKLYNEAKVNEGRRNKDLYERLKEDIERGRQMYSERIPAGVRDSTNYFYDELVRILAGGDANALGPM